MPRSAEETAVEARLHALEAENTRLHAAPAQQAPFDRLQRVEDHLRERARNLRNRFGNHAYRSWFGIDPESMPSMHIREVSGEERYRLNLPYIEGALRGEPQTFERSIPTPDDRGCGTRWPTTSRTSSMAKCAASTCG